MDSFVKLVTSRDFLIAVLAAVSVAAVVFTLGAQFLVRSDMKERIKRVALEREKLRAVEMARLRGGQSSGDSKNTMRREDGSKDYMKRIVERFSLQKAFADEGTIEALARAGYRGQGHLTTYLFMRFVTPLVLCVVAACYFTFVLQGERPLYLNLVYAIGIGLVGAYLPTLMLRNQTTKRQLSLRRAWPDCLDLMLLCVEAGMSVEHAFKRVAKEVGQQSAPLAEELTLTAAAPTRTSASAPASTASSR
jgi:tight adherence protein C